MQALALTPSRVHVDSVRPGSVLVDVVILAPSAAQEAKGELSAETAFQMLKRQLFETCGRVKSGRLADLLSRASLIEGGKQKMP